MHETCHHLHRSPYVLASLLRTPEVYQPRFQEWLDANRAGDAFITDLVRRGVAEESFRPSHQDVEDVVEFAFAGLLRNRGSLSSIRRAALAIDLGTTT